MKTVYELWDTETANLVGSYETREDALAVVSEAVEMYGAPTIQTLALVAEERSGRSRTVATGEALIALAASASPILAKPLRVPSPAP